MRNLVLLAALLALCGLAHAGSIPLIVLKPQTPGTPPAGAMADGYTALFNGDYDGAITHFSYVIAHDPDPMLAYVERSAAYRVKGDADHAIADATQAIKIDPKFGDAFMFRSFAYEEKRDFAHAAADDSEAIRLNPTSHDFYYARGQVEVEDADFDHAIADLTRAIELSKGDPPDSSAAVEDTSQSVYHLVYLTDSPSEWRPNYFRGRAYLGKEDFPKAEADFTEALKTEPTSAEDYLWRSLAQAAEGHDALARSDFAQALALSPNDAGLYAQHGEGLLAAGQFSQAADDLQQAVRIDPKLAPAWSNLGLAYMDLKQPDKAIEAYTRALQVDPSNARIYCNRALALYAKGDYNGAIVDDTAAIQIDPDHAPPWTSRADAYLSTGDLDKALADSSTALRLDHHDLRACAIQANVYMARNDFVHALAAYDRVISEILLADPHDWRLPELYLLRAQISVQRRDFDTAIHDIGLAILINPRVARYWNARGVAYAMKGDLTNAVANFKQALALDPKDPSPRNNLARAQALLAGHPPAPAAPQVP